MLDPGSFSISKNFTLSMSLNGGSRLPSLVPPKLNAVNPFCLAQCLKVMTQSTSLITVTLSGSSLPLIEGRAEDVRIPASGESLMFVRLIR
ncbi:hypothetical protein RRG08_017628 [Elysia crispata]|uniref:Uncharacterized protein n=1 Tax=Elysia crispata TaxID=231223 RepID=A0AAE0ZDR3_9GAST|nr:hypothetical protein RRG08_017628 [Elysia crispata]